MAHTETQSSRRRALQIVLAATIAIVAMIATACGGNETASSSGDELAGTIRIDGSSTVAPLSEAAAEAFQKLHPKVRVTVGTSGTGGGFEKFCNGETDISDASRPIKDSEAQACAAKAIKYDELQVALDGLAVVVNPQNTWANCLTVEQLKKIWEPASTVNNWKDVDPSFPNEPLKLFGAGTDSGTFDYFTEAVNGKQDASRTDYNATEDDNVTVQGVAGTKGGLGYFGLSYLEQNHTKVKGVQVNGGNGCVTPNKETVQAGTYTPLGRPLFVYPKAESLRRPEVLAFLKYYIENSDTIATNALFVPLTADLEAKAKAKIDELSATAP